MSDIKIEGELKLIHNDDAEWDWWTIERAEHEDHHWSEPIQYGVKLMYSGRISDACVEGNSEHMVSIAEGIRNRSGHSEKRCAVEIEGDRAFFHSPRNSQDRGSVPLLVAEALADQIEEAIKL
ncbi:MAG: hypothetical protein DRQ64_00355 [Gammaproteobacteria bacterium]|nr:MAG: hypothetical protein DRQ64_00355 [Gammaproteobacteria bacterium]